MHFELPSEELHKFDPLRESLEETGAKWKIPFEKLDVLVEEDEGMQEMLEDVLDQCLRYTKTVLEERQKLFEEGHGEEYAEWDRQRSITHTATHDTLRAFVRNLVKRGKTANELFPLLPNVESRASCGQFALRLTLSRAAEITV